MTTNDYINQVKTRYPNTYIGLSVFFSTGSPGVAQVKPDFNVAYGNTPLDYVISKVIQYIEHRGVDYLEALINTHYDHLGATHEKIRLMTTTAILHRLEGYKEPYEGLPPF